MYFNVIVNDMLLVIRVRVCERRILLLTFNVITVRNSSCGKVMFSQVSVILSGGDMHGGGACMVGAGHVWQGGCVWQGACMGGGVRGGGGMCGNGVCMARGVATAADGTHPTGMHSCSQIVNGDSCDKVHNVLVKTLENPVLWNRVS